MRQRCDLYTVPTFVTGVFRCPRCGGEHRDLPMFVADPRGPGRLRGGETHWALCPEWKQKVWFRLEDVEVAPHTFKLVRKGVM